MIKASNNSCCSEVDYYNGVDLRSIAFLSQEHYFSFLEYNLSILMVFVFLTMVSKLYPVF